MYSNTMSANHTCKWLLAPLRHRMSQATTANGVHHKLMPVMNENAAARLASSAAASAASSLSPHSQQQPAQFQKAGNDLFG